MARPSSRSRSQTEFRSLILPKGIDLKGELTVQPVESGPEKKQRLKQEMISFYMNEVLATASAFVVLFALILYSFWTLFRGNPDKDERHLALTILSCSMTAVVAFTFGRAKK